MFKKDSLAYLSGYQVIGQKKAGLSSRISGAFLPKRGLLWDQKSRRKKIVIFD